MEPARMIWDVDVLEVRQRNKRPLIAGRFPYGALAVMSDRGTVRKETFNAEPLPSLWRMKHVIFTCCSVTTTESHSHHGKLAILR